MRIIFFLLACDATHTVGTMPQPECGGYAMMQCPDFTECVDDDDDCDPTALGSNCPGHCLPPDRDGGEDGP